MEKKSRVGRPLKFGNPEELQRKIEEYFDSCYDDEGRLIRPLTVSGLAYALDTSRKVLIDYEERDDEYSNAIKKAKKRIEVFAEEQLYTNRNTAGVIFSMVNNYGWRNARQEIDANVNANVQHTHDLRKLSPEQLEQLEDILSAAQPESKNDA